MVTRLEIKCNVNQITDVSIVFVMSPLLITNVRAGATFLLLVCKTFLQAFTPFQNKLCDNGHPNSALTKTTIANFIPLKLVRLEDDLGYSGMAKPFAYM